MQTVNGYLMNRWTNVEGKPFRGNREMDQAHINISAHLVKQSKGLDMGWGFQSNGWEACLKRFWALNHLSPWRPLWPREGGIIRHMWLGRNRPTETMKRPPRISEWTNRKTGPGIQLIHLPGAFQILLKWCYTALNLSKNISYTSKICRQY